MAEYASLREKIAAEKAERLARYAEFERVYDLADAKARAAVEDMVPTPMIVCQRANPLNDNSPVVRIYEPVMDGVCGFAWATVRPGNCSFALWAAKNKGWSKAYQGGMQLWIRDYGQSMERKEAYARVFAGVLRDELNVQAYSGSRMD